MGARYPAAEWVPWAYDDADPSYYRGTNQPAAGVIHIMQGWIATVRTWAANGYSGASWHFSVCRDGRVLQHLELEDGGYQAGIARLRGDGSANPDPTWELWRGWGGGNINNYTIGIEHEGLTGLPFTPEQAAASIALCRWIAATCGFPFDRAHFPSHSDIALIDRPVDFNSRELREQHYALMFSTPEPGPHTQPPVPVGKPIRASREQMKAIQDVLYRRAALIPNRYLATTVDIPVEPSAAHPVRSLMPAGTTVAWYALYVEVDDAPDVQVVP